MDTKRCYHCKSVKPLSEFYKNKSRKDGLDNRCKKCNKDHTKEYYIKNKDHKNEYCKERVIRLRKKLLCAWCGKNKIEFTRSLWFCGSCSNKQIYVVRKREYLLAQKGICARCGKNFIDHNRSNWFCGTCLDKKCYAKKVRRGNNPIFYEDLYKIKEVLDARNKN